MIRRSTVMIREPPQQRYDIFKPFKTFGTNRGGLWAWPKTKHYRSGIGFIPSGTVGVFVGIRVNRAITDTTIHTDLSRIQHDCPTNMSSTVVLPY